MSLIKIIHNPDEIELAQMGVRSWPVWTKEVSEFPWHYESNEVCYLLEGEVIVTPEGDEPVTISAGDLVSFPVGLSCHWKILQDVKQHYHFD
jgi:hypothetical protein